MTKDVHYKYRVTVPEAAKARIRGMGRSGELSAKFVIEELGGDKITIECESDSDAALLTLIFE